MKEKRLRPAVVLAFSASSLLLLLIPHLTAGAGNLLKASVCRMCGQTW